MSNCKILCVHDKDLIERYLRLDTPLHIYEIGDLDDFFWGHTTWFAAVGQARIHSLALLYSGCALPTLLALAEPVEEPLGELLRSIARLLPRRFYAHLSPGLSEVLAGVEPDGFRLEPHGAHCKMTLVDPRRLSEPDTSAVEPLSAADLPQLEQLYRDSYPDSWFEPRMLETGCYFGSRSDDGRLVSVAGVHVLSQRYRVAALGNVATHPQLRGRGLAAATCAKLCRSLLAVADHIGLNVRADNAAAIRCYERLGFAITARYEEWQCEPGGCS